METQAQELMECSSGQAKYEHQHKAIVWRVPRLPKLGQGKIIFFFSFHSAIKGAKTSDLLLSHRTMIVRKYEENSNLLLFFNRQLRCEL